MPGAPAPGSEPVGPHDQRTALKVERAAGFVTTPLADEALRRLHERFVSDPAETDLSALRPVIVRSWLRSHACNVSPDIPFNHEVREPRLDEQLRRCAEPVLAELEQTCRGTGGYVTLTDPLGTLAVFRGEPSGVRWAERLFPIFGASTIEEITGTNSEGTALEEGFGVQVWGSEHYAEMLQDSCCTSVPIRDPLRGAVRGVLTLTLPARVASHSDARSIGLIVQGAVAEVTRSLAVQLTAREQALLSAYLREVRKRGADAVVVTDDRTTIASCGAMQLLDQRDYAVLAGYAREAERLRRPLERDTTVGGGRMLDLQIRPVMVGSDPAGSIIRLSIGAPEPARARASKPVRRSDPFTSLVGNSVALRRALDVAGTAVRRQVPAYFVGESGTGKLHLAKEVAARLATRTMVLDCTDAYLASAADLARLERHLNDGGSVVLHHAESLRADLRDRLAGIVGATDRPAVILSARRLTDELMELTSALGGLEIRMPPLRLRRDDIPLLAAHFLTSLTNVPSAASRRLLQMLTEADWPGNVRQLKEVVTLAAMRATGGEVSVEDLAHAERKALARHPLSRLEEAELHEIRDALTEADGNRVKAAALLQIGRSTLYRKMDMYTRRGFDVGLRPEP